MATATVTTTGVKILLELDEAEAQYVHAALTTTSPALNSNGEDVVYEALGDAMEAAGVPRDFRAAERI